MEPHRPLVPGTGEDCLVISVLVLSLRRLVHDVLPFSRPSEEEKTLEVITETRQERRPTYVIRCAEPRG